VTNHGFKHHLSNIYELSWHFIVNPLCISKPVLRLLCGQSPLFTAIRYTTCGHTVWAERDSCVIYTTASDTLYCAFTVFGIIRLPVPLTTQNVLLLHTEHLVLLLVSLIQILAPWSVHQTFSSRPTTQSQHCALWLALLQRNVELTRVWASFLVKVVLMVKLKLPL